MNMCWMIRKHFIITIAVRSRCEHPTHFTEREIESNKDDFPQVTKVVNGNIWS